MSAEATGWVWRHSPYDGITFTLHLAIADSANDQYGYEFWMSQANLGRKARVSRRSVNKHLGILVKDGYLEVLEQEPGSPVRYRLLFPGDPDTVYESRGGVNAVDRGGENAVHRGVGTPFTGGENAVHTEPKRTQGIRKSTESDHPTTQSSVPDQPRSAKIGSRETLPTWPDDNRTLASTMMEHLKERGTKIPEWQAFHQIYEYLIKKAADELDGARLHTATHKLLCEFIEKATGEPISDTAMKQMGRLVGKYHSLELLRIVNDAIDRGAGLGEAYARDPPRYIINYAMAVRRGERAKHG